MSPVYLYIRLYLERHLSEEKPEILPNQTSTNSEIIQRFVSQKGKQLDLDTW